MKLADLVHNIRSLIAQAALLVFLLLSVSTPAYAAPVQLIMHNEPHLAHARALVLAAFAASGMEVQLEDAPIGNELRVQHLIDSGQVHVSMIPASAERLQQVAEGKLLMVPVPLDRGLLGYRIGLTVNSKRDAMAQVQNSADLKQLIVGQGEGWSDLDIYRHAGIPTHEIKDWTQDVFARQIEAGVMDLYPVGLDETFNYFLDHYRQLYAEVTLEPHLIIRYPWFRFVWVSPELPQVHAALMQGFEQLIESGDFLRIWEHYRQAPTEDFFAERTLIDLANPYYGLEIIPSHWQHLLVDSIHQ